MMDGAARPADGRSSSAGTRTTGPQRQRHFEPFEVTAKLLPLWIE
jgi:hypothetical protein